MKKLSNDTIDSIFILHNKWLPMKYISKEVWVCYESVRRKLHFK